MSEYIELMKCNNPNINIQICRGCKRGTKSKDNKYEQFYLRNTRMNGMQCDGYVSKKESVSLFGEY